MKPQEALMRVIDHHEILHDEMRSLMDQIIEGKISPELTSAIIVGLRVKRETIGEIVAASQVMRNLATKVDLTNPQNLVDTCGTGGDTAHTFNISTAATISPIVSLLTLRLTMMAEVSSGEIFPSMIWSMSERISS